MGVLKRSKAIETLQKHFYVVVSDYDKSNNGNDKVLSDALSE